MTTLDSESMSATGAALAQPEWERQTTAYGPKICLSADMGRTQTLADLSGKP